jgi:predicted RNA binding protein YcfA (HicA-like mRNA interferase family)
MPHLQVLKSQELIKFLNKIGFFEHPEKGTSHLVFKHPDGRRTTVSRHGKDIPNGTLRSILKDIDISPDEFRNLFKN